MSHMAVLVNTQTLDESELERVLQPYHEFECTGIEDEFVQTIDETDVRRAEYLKNTTRVYRFPDGTVEDYYAPEFMRQISEDELMRLTNGTGSPPSSPVEGAVAGVKQATSADKKSDE